MEQSFAFSSPTALDYLKIFWTEAFAKMDMIEKEWEIKKLHLDNHLSFKKITSILSNYQVIIIEFNEYCSVLKLENLGKCILKIFIQIIAIVKGIIKKILLKAKHSETAKDEKENQLVMQPNQYWVQKERGKYEASQMENEITRIQNLYEVSKNMEMKFIKKSKQKVEKIQHSDVDMLITEAYILLESKNRSLRNFLQLKKYEDKKIQSEKEKERSRTKDRQNQFNAQDLGNVGNLKERIAIDKLLKLFFKYYQSMEKKRRSLMISCELQTTPVPPSAVHSKGHISKEEHKRQITRLRQEIDGKNREIEIKNREIKELGKLSTDQRKKVKELEDQIRKCEQKYENQLIKQKMNVAQIQQKLEASEKLRQILISKSQQKSEGKSLKSIKCIGKTEQIGEDDEEYDDELENKMLIKLQLRHESSKSRGSNCIKKTIHFDLSNKLSTCTNVAEFTNYPYPTTLSSIQSEECSGKRQNFLMDGWAQTESIKIEQTSQCQSQQTLSETQDSDIRKWRKSINAKMRYCNEIEIHFELEKPDDETIMNKSRKAIRINPDKIIASSSEILSKKKVRSNWSRKSLLMPTPIEECEPLQSGSPSSSQGKDQKENKKFLQTIYGRNVFSCQNSRKNSRFDLENREYRKMELKRRIPVINNLNFKESDLNNLLLEGCAEGFEYMTNHNKSPAIKSLKRQKQYKIHKKRAESYSQNIYDQKVLSIEVVINDLFQHLRFLKNESFKKYEKIIKFLKFPYSSFQTKEENSGFDEGLQHLQFGDLRKMIYRLQSIHSKCEKIEGLCMCAHLISFLEKIGLVFEQKKQIHGYELLLQ